MSASTRIKFCGLTRAVDVACAVDLGVDMIGLVFASRSPRWLDFSSAALLRDKIPPQIKVVALVMDNPVSEIEQIISVVQPDLLQFHGAEDEKFCRQFGVGYLKAIAMGKGSGRDVVSRVVAWPSAQAVLFDGHGAGEAGGSGQTFDWSRLPAQLEKPFLLAGGLDAGNVADAIRIARPWGVDVSSGIESSPGIKSHERMRKFVVAVRAGPDNLPSS